MEWVIENIGTIVVLAIVIILTILALCYIIKKRKNGTGCKFNCTNCTIYGSCQKNEKINQGGFKNEKNK